jgi:AcrR family transcriptional regulator
VSRVTLYRRGASKARVAAALREELAREERLALWPALTGDGTGRERLEATLRAYCGATERHLELFEIVSDSLGDTVYHEEGDDVLTRGEFTDPIRRLLLDGATDGTLREVADVDETATVVYNTVGWIYQHLRRGHGWTPDRASRAVVSLVVDGLAA